MLSKSLGGTRVWWFQEKALLRGAEVRRASPHPQATLTAKLITL